MTWGSPPPGVDCYLYWQEAGIARPVRLATAVAVALLDLNSTAEDPDAPILEAAEACAILAEARRARWAAIEESGAGEGDEPGVRPS